jgi:hypothetical protein
MSDGAFAPAAIDIHLIDVDVLPVHITYLIKLLKILRFFDISLSWGKARGKVFINSLRHNYDRQPYTTRPLPRSRHPLAAHAEINRAILRTASRAGAHGRPLGQ